MPLGHDQIHSAASYIKDRMGAHRPTLAMVLGSGLGAFADSIQDAVAIPYHDIPHFPVSTVEGHKGRMVIGAVGGRSVLVMQGRVHGYEGYDPTEVVFPLRAMIAAGVRTVVLTNAAGTVNVGFQVGDLMLITDHLNLTGKSPLAGPNDGRLGVRFPDMSTVYAANLRECAHAAARQAGVSLREGVYIGLNGPQYETPAEIRMVRTLGADAVGMSTVHEAIAARHMGAGVVGVSCITNLAAGLSPTPLSHTEVKEVADRVEGKMMALMTRLCAALP